MQQTVSIDWIAFLTLLLGATIALGGLVRYVILRDERVREEALQAIKALREDVDTERFNESTRMNELVRQLTQRIEAMDLRQERRTDDLGKKIDGVFLELVKYTRKGSD